MDHKEIERKAREVEKEWKAHIRVLPLSGHPGWERAFLLHTTFEWLAVIAEQLRKGSAREIKYRILRTMLLDGKIAPIQPSPRKSRCYNCYMPLERGEGMVYKLDDDSVDLCVLCDPQYEHCPFCHSPIVGKCEKCNLIK